MTRTITSQRRFSFRACDIANQQSDLASIPMRAAAGIILGCIALASAADAPRFFPNMDAFKAQWYGKQLQAVQEKSLCCDSTRRGRVVRFLWLRSFQPAVIRLNELTAGSWRVVTKTATGTGGGEPGTVATVSERTLTAGDAAPIRALFNSTSWIWRTASAQATSTIGNCAPDKTCVTLAGDGSQWIVEVRDGSGYHYVDRWSPKDGPVHDIGEQFIALSQQDFGTIP
jgi:hypothetical protein